MLTTSRRIRVACVHDTQMCSYYTQAAARGVPGMTAAVGANPFFKSSKFTKPAGEHSDMIDEPAAWATEEVGSAAVHAGGELTMHEVLERLRVAIRARGGDNGIKTLTRVLRRMDATGDGLLSLEELGDGLRDMGIEASRRDVSALMLYFGACVCVCVCVGAGGSYTMSRRAVALSGLLGKPLAGCIELLRPFPPWTPTTTPLHWQTLIAVGRSVWTSCKKGWRPPCRSAAWPWSGRPSGG